MEKSEEVENLSSYLRTPIKRRELSQGNDQQSIKNLHLLRCSFIQYVKSVF